MLVLAHTARHTPESVPAHRTHLDTQPMLFFCPKNAAVKTEDFNGLKSSLFTQCDGASDAAWLHIGPPRRVIGFNIFCTPFSMPYALEHARGSTGRHHTRTRSQDTATGHPQDLSLEMNLEHPCAVRRTEVGWRLFELYGVEASDEPRMHRVRRRRSDDFRAAAAPAAKTATGLLRGA